MTMLKLPHDFSEGTTSKGVEWKGSPQRKGSQGKRGTVIHDPPKIPVVKSLVF